MDSEKITLEFDDGAVIEFDVIGVFDIKGTSYVALLDAEEDQEYLFKYIENGDDFELDEIPEEDFDMVSEEYEKIMESLEE